MMFFANAFTKRGGISLLFLCLCISISGPAQSQDATDPATSATIPATSPVGPTASSVGPTTSSVVPTGATQDPTATTVGKTADTKSTLDSPTTLPQPGLTPPVTGGATATIPTTSAGTILNSTTTLPAPAGPGGFTAPLQDGNGKKIVFPITDTNGRVIFQSATDMHISGMKGGNSTSPSTKTPAGSSDSKGDKNAKNGAKPNSGNLLTSLPKSIITSLSLGVVVIMLA